MQSIKLIQSAEAEGSSSLIGRQWRVVCTIFIISYVAIQILITYSASHICKDTQGFAAYTYNFGHAFVGKFYIPPMYF